MSESNQITRYKDLITGRDCKVDKWLENKEHDKKMLYIIDKLERRIKNKFDNDCVKVYQSEFDDFREEVIYCEVRKLCNLDCKGDQKPRKKSKKIKDVSITYDYSQVDKKQTFDRYGCCVPRGVWECVMEFINDPDDVPLLGYIDTGCKPAGCGSCKKKKCKCKKVEFLPPKDC